MSVRYMTRPSTHPQSLRFFWQRALAFVAQESLPPFPLLLTRPAPFFRVLGKTGGLQACMQVSLMFLDSGGCRLQHFLLSGTTRLVAQYFAGNGLVLYRWTIDDRFGWRCLGSFRWLFILIFGCIKEEERLFWWFDAIREECRLVGTDSDSIDEVQCVPTQNTSWQERRQ